MEEAAGDHVFEQDGKQIMRVGRCGRGPAPLRRALAVRVCQYSLLFFISFPRERSMYPAVHMCGSFPANRVLLHSDCQSKIPARNELRHARVSHRHHQFTVHSRRVLLIHTGSLEVLS